MDLKFFLVGTSWVPKVFLWVSSLAPKIWELIPSEIKSAKSLNFFKAKIKSWIADKYLCRFCKTYVGNIGFI